MKSVMTFIFLAVTSFVYAQTDTTGAFYIDLKHKITYRVSEYGEFQKTSMPNLKTMVSNYVKQHPQKEILISINKKSKSKDIESITNFLHSLKTVRYSLVSTVKNR